VHLIFGLMATTNNPLENVIFCMEIYDGHIFEFYAEDALNVGNYKHVDPARRWGYI
jgi:hypothetical protein